MLNKKSAGPEWLWRPRMMSLIYVCEDQEVHEIRGLVWGKKLWFKKDRSLFPLSSVAPLFFGFGRSGEVAGPTDSNGKPVIQ